MSSRHIFTFEKKNEQNTRTVTKSEICDDFIAVFDEMFESGKKRFENYLVDSNLLKNSLCYTVTYCDEKPMLASVAWRKPFYNGMVRLCSRYCVTPSFVNVNFGKGMDGIRLDAIDHIEQQKEFCEKLGYEDFFISRFDRTNGRLTKIIYDGINKYSTENWKMSDAQMLVCPDPSNKECWQYVVYNTEIKFDLSK